MKFLFLSDMGESWDFSFQDGANTVKEQMMFFHDEIMYLLTLIMVLVLWVMMRSLMNKYYHKNLTEGVLLEVLWTLFPAGVLILIAMPSLKLLYLMDEVMSPRLTLKMMGHQWYWYYEYSDYKLNGFDSYMMPSSDLECGKPSLLDVDNSLKVPVNTEMSLLVTGGDVLHSFAVPSLGIKVDAVPGRLNQCDLVVKSNGMYFGQCSEICGANHSFMPIVVKSLNLEEYVVWTAGVDAVF